MKIRVFTLFLLFKFALLSSQNTSYTLADRLDLEVLQEGKLHKIWLKLGENEQNEAIKIPILIAKGTQKGEVLGLTAAIHGNELNGIAVIHRLMNQIDSKKLKGIVIAIPGLNPLAVAANQREFTDGTDLNRIFPGKSDGNRSEQMAYRIGEKLIPLFNYHVDLHTASFGRVNSLYGRGNMKNDTLATMLKAIAPDIIVSNKGKASFGTTSGMTMRAYAINKGVKSVTVEYGDPQVFQEEIINRGVEGLKNLMTYFGFLEGAFSLPPAQHVCVKSYWLYTDKGGYLEILVTLKQKIKKDMPIAVLKDAFGDIIKTYRAPEDGIVIGKSTNPISISGSRIIHLGILGE